MIWKHKKTEEKYQIICFGVEEATLKPVVIYQKAHCDSAAIWTRPCDEFFDGRFEEVGADQSH